VGIVTRKRIRMIALAIAYSSGTLYSAQAQDALSKIKTIVVIYAENRSFDHLYGLFPGANGIANATTEQKTQLDHDGTPLLNLTVFGNGGKPDPRFPNSPWPPSA
jgi:phospholipase C